MSNSLSVVATDAAPPAVGHYSQAIRAGGFLFVSGCIPLDPQSMAVVPGGVTEQATQVMTNLDQIVKAGGSSKEKVVKTTIFLKSMNDFAAVNEVYTGFFGNHKPARSTIEVARLPKDVLVEVECIAMQDST